MKIRKNRIKWWAPVLAVLLVIPCLIKMQTKAAGGIEPDRDCSLTVSVEIGGAMGGNNAYLEDLNQMSIPVSVYQVATVDGTGQRFTPAEAFAPLDFQKINGAPGEVTAADWQALGEEAEKIRQEAGADAVLAAGETEVKTEEGSSLSARGVITGLKPGLYLVAPEKTYSPDYTFQYSFTPYLTALPTSEYALTGSGSDQWDYDPVIGLKPDAVRLYGRLNITKVLLDYNATLGPATFVFHVEGTDGSGVTRYEEVAGLTFTEAGSSTATLEGIPAGLTVTVTEVYSGASYTLEGSGSDTALIWSGEAVSAGMGEEASVTFVNRYDGGNRSGYGVTNRFESDGEGGWLWENPTRPLED